MSNPSIIDLDALFADELTAGDDTVVAKVKLLGQEWDLIDSDNAFNSLRTADFENNPSVLTQLMLGLIHPSQRSAFTGALGRVQKLTAETLVKLINALVEAVAQRPTEPPSDSADTSTTPSSGPNSTEPDSATEAAPSES